VKVIAIIPARYASSRLPGKPLVEIRGKPLIQYVYERVIASSVDQVVVATDDERIALKVKEFGGEAMLTASHHRTGTERVAEVAAVTECDIVVNVQGDEPLIVPKDIDRVVFPLQHDPSIDMTTLIAPLVEGADLFNPHVVKVVIDRQGFALYFSRSPVPHSWDLRPAIGGDYASLYQHFQDASEESLEGYWQHAGLYAFRKEFLLTITSLPPSPLEKREGLEQLRVLENGYAIKTVVTFTPSIGIDTPEDLERFKSTL